MSRRNVVVVGAARSGVAAALLLAARGARVTLTDVRTELDDLSVEPALRRAGITLELGGHRTETFAGADLIVLSPGVPLQQLQVAAARRSGVPVLGEIELASRWLSGRIVAITGTKGKSTTTTLTGRMFQAGGFKALVGGNIGTPLSAQVDESTPETFHIVEVSSFQLETIDTFHPWIAVLLNISADHLDRHPSMEEYGAAKARMFANQTERDWAVINADDPQALALARLGRARRLLFAIDRPLDEGVFVKEGQAHERRSGKETPLFPLSAVRLTGRHLLSNVLAAAAIARIAGVPAEAMARAVESFTTLEHVLEPVGVVRSVSFINDSKATDVEAAQRAIESFGRDLVVILGGQFKGGNLGLLGAPLAARRAAVVAIGEARPLIHAALRGTVPVHDAETMAAAVRLAFTLAPQNGIVLLAPACASKDMFRNYAERGQVFKEEVRRLAEETNPGREQ